jgi:hypothetical protein
VHKILELNLSLGLKLQNVKLYDISEKTLFSCEENTLNTHRAQASGDGQASCDFDGQNTWRRLKICTL